ncbi:MAG: lipase [Umezawaea sp.]
MSVRSVRRRSLLAVLLAAVFALVSGVLAGAPAAGATTPVQLTFPAPTGPHAVGVVKAHLVDNGRADPWKPDRKRELMTSIYFPAQSTAGRSLSPWMSPGVVPKFDQLMADPRYLAIPSGSVDWAGAKSHSYLNATLKTSSRWPIVLFSAAQGTSRELSTVLLEDLASRGYIVIAIDHTYEQFAVEFPGGRVEQGLPLDRTPETQKKSIDSRVADTKFVLDTLFAAKNGTSSDIKLPADIAASLNTNKIGVFGHVHGGYTAAETMSQDTRLVAGLNLDGALAYSQVPYLPGSAAQNGLGNRPLLLMGARVYDRTGTLVDHNHVNGGDQSWTDFWSNHNGWKRDLTLDKSALDSYTDFTAFLPQVAAQVPIPPSMVELFIGKVDPERSIVAQRAYVSAFFGLFLRGTPTSLFNGASPLYPEVKFVS